MSPSPSSLPEGSTPPSTSGKGHRLQSSVVRVQPSPPIDHNDRWRPHDEGQSRSRDTGRASKSVEADGRGRRTAEDSSHKHHDHRGASRDSSRDRGHRDRHREEHHRSQRNSSTQVGCFCHCLGSGWSCSGSACAGCCINRLACSAFTVHIVIRSGGLYVASVCMQQCTGALHVLPSLHAWHPSV